MANALKMAVIEAILSLCRRGWSRRRIARELGIDRETVSRHLRAATEPSNPANAPLGSAAFGADPKPAIAPIGSGQIASDSKPANAPIGSEAPREDAAQGQPEPKDTSQVQPAPTDALPSKPMDLGAGRPSDCAPWRAVIQAKLDQGLTAQRIYQDLITEHGFGGSYYSVRRFTRRLGQGRSLPFRRLECGPGEEAQVDFGTGAPIRLAEGRLRRPHVFRIVLSHSRKGYSEAVSRQTTDNFLRCLENAFWHFGGVPQRLVLDNLRAAVSKADWFDPELNPKVQAFAAHYGLVMLPTKPRTPRHKGKIERGIGYVKGNALKGHVFASLDEQNQHLLHWEQTVADTRMHGTIRQQVGKLSGHGLTLAQALALDRGAGEIQQRLGCSQAGFALTAAARVPAEFAFRLQSSPAVTAEAQVDLPAAGPVRVDVFDINGRLVRTAFDAPLAPGTHSIAWDGRAAEGGRAPVGVYFLRVVSGRELAVARFVLLR